jgi:hypothetical protein
MLTEGLSIVSMRDILGMLKREEGSWKAMKISSHFWVPITSRIGIGLNHPLNQRVIKVARKNMCSNIVVANE